MNHVKLFSDQNGIKLEINNKKKFGKSTDMWTLNNTLLNSQWVKEETARQIVKYLEIIDNKNTIYQNLWDAVIVVLIAKFIAVNAYIKK